MNNEDIYCSTFFNTYKNSLRKLQMAQALKLVEKVEQTDNNKLPTYKEINDF